MIYQPSKQILINFILIVCFFIMFSTKWSWCLKTSSPWSMLNLKSTASALTDSSHLTGNVTYNEWTYYKYSHTLKKETFLNRLPSLSFCSSSCVPSRFQTPSDSLVLKEGQSSSMQEPILASPAAAPPLPFYQRDEPAWTGGDRPPHGADNGDHVRLDSLQVRTLMKDERFSQTDPTEAADVNVQLLNLL